MNIKKLFSSVLCGVVMGMLSYSGVASAVTVDVDNAANGSENVPAATNQYPEVDGKRIVINLASRGLYLYNQGVKTRLYPIAVGKASTPTPTGYYHIVDMEVNPTWTDPKTGRSIPSGPSCPIGYRWMGLFGNYGIHGTNNDASIGTYASNGCIRMHEKDVDELYDLVSMQTPVDITYNRVVVEKAGDDTVVYYIYPDGYGWQSVSSEDVNAWLKGFGVDAFVSEDDIAQKINNADGNPTYIAKAYEIRIEGKKTGSKAVIRDGITYLPVVPLAKTINVNLTNNNGIIVSKYGRVPAYIFKDHVFINGDDAEELLGLQGGLREGKYEMSFVNGVQSAPVVTENTNDVESEESTHIPAAVEEKTTVKSEQENVATVPEQAPASNVESHNKPIWNTNANSAKVKFKRVKNEQ